MDFLRALGIVGTAKAPSSSQGNIVSRSQVDSQIADYIRAARSGMSVLDPTQFASQLANNQGGVSYQEIQSRLGAGLAGVPSPSIGQLETSINGSGYAGLLGGDSDPNAIASSRSAISNYIQQLNDIYNSIYGKVNQVAQEKRNNLEQDYGKQFADLQQSYDQTAKQLSNMYAARGIADSSYSGQGQYDAGQTFSRESGALRNNYNQNLANIGQFVTSAISPYKAAQQQLGQLNPAAYSSVSQLQAIQNQLAGNLQNAQQAQAGLGTQNDYINQINAIAPYQQTGSATLQNQLKTLAGSSAPGFAKTQVANALVQQQQQDPAFYQDYFQKLLQQQGA